MATLGCLIRTLRSVTTGNGEEKGGEINCAWVKCRSGYDGGSDVGEDSGCGIVDREIFIDEMIIRILLTRSFSFWIVCTFESCFSCIKILMNVNTNLTFFCAR